MKRLLLVLLVVAIVASSAFAGGTKEGPKKVVLAYVCKVLDNPWFQATTSAFKAKALALGASDVLLLDSKMDPELAMSQIDTLISQKVSGIVCNLPDEKLSRAVVDKCNAAKIPIIGTDDPLVENGKRIAPTLELDSYDAGYVMGDYLAKYVKEKGLIKDVKDTMYINLAGLQIASFVQRTKGANDAWSKILPDYPADRMITADTDTVLTEEGFQTMSAQIVAHPEVKTWFVTTVNDEVAIGAARALEQAKLDRTSYVAGLGGYLAKNEFKKDFTCIVASSHISAIIDGETNAQAMMDYVLKGKEIFGDKKKAGQQFGTFWMPSLIVTKDNFRSVMGKDAD
jgi:L-arabinose transport system substrate-binding protein